MTAEQMNLVVGPGRISAGVTGERGAREPRAQWIVPPADDAEIDRAVRRLAAEPALEGRWREGLLSDTEREALGILEQEWRSECECGGLQPCRHAQSVLFLFRREAKRNPGLWWEAVGASREAVQEAIRAARAEAAKSGRDAKDAEAEAKAVRSAETSGQGGGEPWILGIVDDPPFWNRDVPFAEWLRPLANAASAKEGNRHHVHESDSAMDAHVRERP